jgi:hypothetical protein
MGDVAAEVGEKVVVVGWWMGGGDEEDDEDDEEEEANRRSRHINRSSCYSPIGMYGDGTCNRNISEKSGINKVISGEDYGYSNGGKSGYASMGGSMNLTLRHAHLICRCSDNCWRWCSRNDRRCRWHICSASCSLALVARAPRRTLAAAVLVVQGRSETRSGGMAVGQRRP